MSSIHYGLTVSTKINPGKRPALEDLLTRIQEGGVADNDLFPFGRLTTTHFTTWVILPEEKSPDGKKLPERLLLLTSYTGSKRKHIQELVEVGLKGLHEAYQFCEKYPFDELPEVHEMEKYLRKFSVRNTFYTGFQYITLKDVGQENQLREAIQGFLDEEWKKGDISNLSPVELRNKIQGFVKSKPELSFATKPYRRSFTDFIRLFSPLIGLLTVLGGALVLSILLIFMQNIVTWMGLVIFGGFIGVFVLLLLLLRINESRPHEDIKPVTDERIYEITSKETYPVKNEMTVEGPLKAGLIRRIFLAFILWLVPFVRAYSYIPTVHTARWLQVDGGRRIVFVAYFDNTSEGYAHDFVDSKKRTRNLNLILGHGYGFPPTRFAIHGGGKDRKRYIIAVRANQKITQLWYSTHKQLGILNITNNRDIRKGLFGDLDKDQIEKWLLRL